MAAAVVPIQPFGPQDPSADARKRRREILALQRTVPDMPLSVEDPIGMIPTKRRKVQEELQGSSKKAKKPQKKYDPEVPMTKEEAAVWRREQRRKRNRESAAASRQRQRDRIAELEVEVGECKDKYNEIIQRIRKLEDEAATKNLDVGDPFQTEFVSTSSMVSPPSSPEYSPMFLSSPLSTSDASTLVALDVVQSAPQVHGNDPIVSDDELDHQPDNMISRRAKS